DKMPDVDGIERAKEQADPGSVVYGSHGVRYRASGISFFLNSSYNRWASASEVSRTSLSRTTSHWSLKVVSNFALNMRRQRLSSVSVPRSLRRVSNTSIGGTLTQTASARTANSRLRFSSPLTSTSKTTFFPSCQIRSISDFRVP